MRPKSTRRGLKIDTENEDEKRRLRGSFWSGLGPILGRLGSCLGVVEWGFAEGQLHFVKSHVFGKIRCQEAT